MNQTISTYRIYGKILETWTTTKENPFLDGDEYECEVQREVEFTEYYEDGAIYEVGSEDFSPKNYKRLVDDSKIWTWDGKSYNQGGKRKFEYEGNVRYRRGDRKLVLTHLSRIYPEAKLIQLRNT